MARKSFGEAPRFGRKLRYARKLKGMKLAEVAAQAGCSEGLLSKVENNQTVPSVTLLHRLVQTLDTNITWLFTPEDSEQEIVTRQGERPEIDFGRFQPVEGTAVESVAPFFQGNLIQVMLFTVSPGGRSSEDISHKGEDFGYILEGRILLHVDGVEYELGPGDSFQFASERPHGYVNKFDQDARILWVNTPPTF